MSSQDQEAASRSSLSLAFHVPLTQNHGIVPHIQEISKPLTSTKCRSGDPTCIQTATDEADCNTADQYNHVEGSRRCLSNLVKHHLIGYCKAQDKNKLHLNAVLQLVNRFPTGAGVAILKCLSIY